jgi:predicted nucleotidyltransferase
VSGKGLAHVRLKPKGGLVMPSTLPTLLWKLQLSPSGQHPKTVGYCYCRAQVLKIVAVTATLVAMKATNVSLSDLLFPAQNRRKALNLLLLHPERSLHVREIARLASAPAGTMVKELDRLHEVGLLIKARVGNQVQFSANRHHPVFSELVALLQKTVGLADILTEALAPLAERLRFAFVFGSMARGTEHEGSDVDVLIVGDVDFASVLNALYDAQAKLQREINPKVLSPEEWAERVQSGSSFVHEVLAKPKIFLIGGEDDIGVPAKPGQGRTP